MESTIVLKQITDFYLNSRDFNGIPIKNLGEDIDEVKTVLIQLLDEDKIVLNFGDRHPNPHILALKPEPKEEQLEKLNNGLDCCVYPASKHLESFNIKDDYKDEPYRLGLALGEPQLSYRAFNLRVLEFYKNDPRFSYSVSGVSGSMSAKSNGNLIEEDKVFLQTFGFAYDPEIKNRYVAVYLWYLFRLSPAHQQRWALDEYKGKTFLHPEYARTSAGHWSETIPIFDAFCEEIGIINQMAEKFHGVPFFRNSYDISNKPRDFCFLIRPTSKEFEDFVHILDKIISDNVNKKFFKGLVELVESEKKGEIYIERQKGTIRLLEEWLATWKFPDQEPIKEMISIFKEIRSKRQPQAHHVRENEWDDSLFSKQRDLIIKAYQGIRTLRLVFANYPTSQEVEIPEALFKGKICSY